MAVLRALEACKVCVEKCDCDYCKACVESGWKKSALVHASLCDVCAKTVAGAMMHARIEALQHFEREFAHKIQQTKDINAHPSKAMVYSAAYIGAWEEAMVKLGAAISRLHTGEGYDPTTRLNDKKDAPQAAGL